jgi:predicted CopG family antitoxin
MKGLCMISAYQDSMSVTENIPVSEETYNQILDLRRPDETLNDTLARLVDKIKKQRLTDDIEEVMARNEFVELDL